MNKEIEIPEGYKARIEGNKVIIELQESEDERIRKEIISALKFAYVDGVYDKHIAWLEKQKKLFKSGSGLYYYDGKETIYCGYPTTEERQGARTIGNVAKEITKDRSSAMAFLKNAEIVDENGELAEKYRTEGKEQYTEWSEDERISKFFAELATDACGGPGQEYYEELGLNYDKVMGWLEKQKEQKPAELPKSEDYGIDELYAAVDILQKTLGEVDGYQSDDGILEHKCAISAVKELYEQKPVARENDFVSKPIEWSDNFEENIRNLLHDKLTWHSEDGSISSTVFIDDKTLKDIICGIWFYVGKEALKYPNKELNVTEWSEEDERNFYWISTTIQERHLTPEYTQQVHKILSCSNPSVPNLIGSQARYRWMPLLGIVGTVVSLQPEIRRLNHFTTTFKKIYKNIVTMKANELMIGDWVLCPDSSREHIIYVQIDAIEEGYGYSLLVTKQRSDWFVDVSEIQPIPLTDEFLEKNGFVPKGAYALPGEDIGVKRTGNCWALLCYYGDYTGFPFCHISYLHELQHALKLCGIEKEITI